MVFAVPVTNQVITTIKNRNYLDACVCAATNTRLVAGCFAAENSAGSGYYQVARDTASCSVAGVIVRYVNNEHDTESYPYTQVLCGYDLQGVFPVATTTASVPGTDLYVLGTGNGNTLTHTGNVQVGETITPVYRDGSPAPTHTGYVRAYINPRVY